MYLGFVFITTFLLTNCYVGESHKAYPPKYSGDKQDKRKYGGSDFSNSSAREWWQVEMEQPRRGFAIPKGTTLSLTPHLMIPTSRSEVDGMSIGTSFSTSFPMTSMEYDNN